MIMARTITSPGVEINERDLSLRPIIPTGTSVLIPGFAHQGPTDEVFQITSLSECETVYGLPTNAAERYFHKTAKAVFNSNARVLATRLPYGTGAGLGVGVEVIVERRRSSNDFAVLFIFGIKDSEGVFGQSGLTVIG